MNDNMYLENKSILIVGKVWNDTHKNTPLLYRDLNLAEYVFNPEVGDGRRYQEAVNALPWDSLDYQKMNTRITRADHVIKCRYNYGTPLQVSYQYNAL